MAACVRVLVVLVIDVRPPCIGQAVRAVVVLTVCLLTGAS